MVTGDSLYQIWWVVSVLRGVDLRTRKGIIEDTGDPSWDAISSYLDYEEPEYNQSRGFTADDFTNHLQGYQTEPSIAKSFGWEMSTFGEVPFAALLVRHDKTKFCMGTVITTEATVTPCACVIKSALWAALPISNHGDGIHSYRTADLFDYYHYEYDLGDNFDVVANHIEYYEEHVGKHVYPHMVKVLSDRCWIAWTYTDTRFQGATGPDGYKRYQQLFEPAIIIMSKKLEFHVPCPWPPLTIAYHSRAASSDGIGGKSRFPFKKRAKEAIPGVISSFKFIPLEDTDLSMDNDGRDTIRTKDRLVNLQVKLCYQNLCNVSVSFDKLIPLFAIQHHDLLKHMLCWCDVPWLGDESIYQKVKNEEAPVYFKSVYDGLVGAPVVDKGRWVGWTVETVSREATERALRPIWTRGVDSDMVAFFESRLPDLNNSAVLRDVNPDDDVNRGSFAVHDLKSFVPDSYIKEEDLDLQGWAQIGNRRFLREKLEDARSRNSVATISPTHAFGLLCFFWIL